ncbi:MAG: TRAP transporter substrate-binding protein [Deltaproteobacteria bacterium]|nr:TRAP transporter substrate-binding protein [Deltaproteobacteria bacterium]MDZ4342547.1 TRAP transporter substrate-binding protein [Candidatus Binatia bacterium]
MAGFLVKFFTLRAGIVASALVALLYSGATSAELPRLSVAHKFAQNHPVHQALERFRENLAGVVSVEVNAPRNERETVQGMISGASDATVISSAVFQQTVSELGMLDLIGLWRDRAHWARALDGEAGREFSALVGRAKSGAGFQVLGYWGGTQRYILTRRDGVPKIEDLNGLRLQILFNPVRSKMWKALGVQPVLPTQPDLSAMLRAGTVDGIEEEAEVIVQTRLFEVASHLTETGHAIATRLFIIAKPAWQKLTPPQQAALTAAAQKAAAVARAGELERETTALTSLKERFGVRLHSFTGQEALVSRTRPFRARYAEEMSISRLFTLIEKTAKP